jgi:hypothetical protein
MDYQVFGDKVVIRLDNGDELLESMQSKIRGNQNERNH